jgi:GT2 family glycosyltransferase
MSLPAPPSLAEILAHTPRIATVPDSSPRPFWSVMIATYNSGPYLRRTLESVLRQDPGPETMQIEVVDGGSVNDAAEEITRELGRGRVPFYRLPSNQGPAHTFNTCIERSRGRWVHILHGDDVVQPDFYEAYAAATRAEPRAVMVLGQVVIIDEADRWMRLQGPIPPAGGGVLPDFVEQQAWQQLVMCPSVVVQRDAYEQAGGFCTLFASVTDWDLWFRLGQLGPVACVPRPLSLYRHHRGSETARLYASDAVIWESYHVVKANLERLGKPGTPEEWKAWRSDWATKADRFAWELDSRNSTAGRYSLARCAWMLDPNWRRLVMLAKSWLKHELKPSGAGAPAAALREST